MSEKWEVVPAFKLDAGRKHILAELHPNDEREVSVLGIDQAKAIEADIRALGDRLEDAGADTIGWALQWIADDLKEAIEAADRDQVTVSAT